MHRMPARIRKHNCNVTKFHIDVVYIIAESAQQYSGLFILISMVSQLLTKVFQVEKVEKL